MDQDTNPTQYIQNLSLAAGGPQKASLLSVCRLEGSKHFIFKNPLSVQVSLVAALPGLYLIVSKTLEQPQS